MKNVILLLSMVVMGHSLKAQTPDSITRKSIIQLGYVSEYIDGGSASRLSGVEAQIKYLLGRHKFAKGESPDVLAYFNAGYTYFPNTDYSLGQLNAGFGINTEAPLVGKLMRMDISLGAAYYHGKVYDKVWYGKTIDFGGAVQLSIPIKNNFGIYGKFWMPGIISSASDDAYISPMFITAGIEF